MIKRLLLFLLLFGTLMLVLHFALGGEQLASFRKPERQQRVAPDEEGGRSRGIALPTGSSQEAGAADKAGSGVGSLSLDVGGGVRLSSWRTVPVSADRSVQVLLYEIVAEDSESLADDLLRLRQATIHLYEVGGSSAEPQTVEAAHVRARTMLVRLGRDASGRQSLDEHKDFDLRDVVVATTPQARVKDLTMQVGRVLVRMLPDAVHLRTPSADEAFEVRLAGGNGLLLTGRGLEARLPIADQRPRNDKSAGNAPPAAARPEAAIDIRVDHDPFLVQGPPDRQITARAAGTLRYAEVDADGLARITMQDAVEVHGLAAADDGEASVARGDRLQAVLRRGKRSEELSKARPSEAPDGAEPGVARKQAAPAVHWSGIVLEGSAAAPATLQTRYGTLTCIRLDALPGAADAEPWLLSASGGRPQLRQRDAQGRETRFTADRIHLVRLRPHLGPWLEPFGVPGAMLAQELVGFEGAAEVADEARGLRASGSEGLRVLKTRGGTSLVALGDVEVHAADTLAKGNMGALVLQRAATSADTAGEPAFDLRLGPEEPDAKHVYRIERDGLRLTGTGSCRLSQDGAGASIVALRSPDAAIVAELDGRTLRDATQLDAELAAGVLRSFVATGRAAAPVAMLARDEDGKEIRGRAQRIESLGPDTFLLTGTPASLWRSAEGELSGRKILLHRLPDGALLVRADGEARLLGGRGLGFAPSARRGHAAGGTVGDGGDDQTVELRADTILRLPHLVPAHALAAWRLQLPAAAATVFGTTAAAAHLVARGAVWFEQRQAGRLAMRATGHELVFREQPLFGRLLGDAAAPARLSYQDAAGRENTGEAPIVLLWTEGDEGAEKCMALLPGSSETRFVLRGATSAIRGLPSGGNTVITCRSPVEFRGNEILFLGPVRMQTLRADGSPDPEGLSLTANGMRAERDALTEEITNLAANGGAHLRLSGSEAIGEELTLDLQRKVCMARDPAGGAWFRLPNGVQQRAMRAEFNYETYAFSIWGGRTTGPEQPAYDDVRELRSTTVRPAADQRPRLRAAAGTRGTVEPARTIPRE